MKRGKYLRAREILERLVGRYPAESDLHLMLAQTCFEAGDGEAAVAPLIDALRWDPENRSNRTKSYVPFWAPRSGRPAPFK